MQVNGAFMKKNRCNMISVFLSVMICMACHNANAPLHHVENPIAGAESEKEVLREIIETGRTAVRQFSISFRSDPVNRFSIGDFDIIALLSEKIRYSSFPGQVMAPSLLLSTTVLRV
jgi:hypothetical protein